VQRVLQLLENHLQGLACSLARFAASHGQEESLLPGFVAGLQPPRVQFQTWQQLPLAAQVVPYLRKLLGKFEDPGLVVLPGFLHRNRQKGQDRLLGVRQVSSALLKAWGLCHRLEARIRS
jgi:hypothetical protein